MSDDDAILKPGDWLLCENGHRVLKARRPIRAIDSLNSQDFEDEAGASPAWGSPAGYCPACGGRYFRKHGSGVRPWAIGRAVMSKS